MAVLSEDGRVLKHYAQDKDTNTRYVIISLENENDKNTCSVVDIDALDSTLRSELIYLINSDECQNTFEPFRVLDRHFFTDYKNGSMLAVLKAKRLIKSINSTQIHVAGPDNKERTPKELMECIRLYYKTQKMKNTGFVADDTPVEQFTSGVESIAQQPVQNNEELETMKKTLEQQSQTLTVLTELVTQLTAKLSEPEKKPAKKSKK